MKVLKSMALLAVAASLLGAAPATVVRPGTLQQDVDAIQAAGATAVLAEVRTAAGRRAARTGGVPFDAHYRIGSTSKTFTATVALQLVAEGRLALTDTVERWLPGLVRGNGHDGRRITVANLLRQTSGLPDYDERLPWVTDLTPARFGAERFRAYDPVELVVLALNAPPQWLPRPDHPAAETRWSYSNTNYVLARMIIEKVTGHSWEQELHERVIEPLGLHHTYTASGSAYLPAPRATGYTRFPGAAELTDTTVFTPLPDAPIISTTADVTTFLRALLDGRLLRPAQLAAMKQTVEAREEWETTPGARYGLGISWRPAAGCAGGVWSHGGTMPGYVTEAAVTAKGDRAVAVSTSTWSFDEDQAAREEATAELVDHALCRH
jgi:D-alanyl-D-alanine carboxypeptidase